MELNFLKEMEGYKAKEELFFSGRSSICVGWQEIPFRPQKLTSECTDDIPASQQ